MIELEQARGVAAVSAEATGIPIHLLEALTACGAADMPHSGRTLLAHLLGTHALLQQWGADDDTCLAGLFHSIYGTNAFRHPSLPVTERGRIQELIGQRAEHLAWTFCSIDRPQAILGALRKIGFGNADTAATGSAPTTSADWRSLATIECANLVEQQTSMGRLREFFCLAMDCPGNLPSAVSDALRRALASKPIQGSPSA